MIKLLVFIEACEDSLVNVSKEISEYACMNLNDVLISGVLLTGNDFKESLIAQLQNSGLDNLYVIADERFKSYVPQACTAAITSFLKHNPQDVFLMGATSFGRELAPRVAARNNLGLTADCTEIALDEQGKLLATRPTYGGQLMATIVSKTSPAFATIRPGALKVRDFSVEKPLNVFYFNPDLQNIIESIKVVSVENKALNNDIESAQLIVAGGLGMKSKENFALIYEFAELIGAQPAASRAAVELGWASPDIQVGQTGHTVSPKLYLAFGISGAMQHLVGISGADRIVAVNTDKNAPIFESADIGIVADAADVLRNLIVTLKQ